MKYFTIDELCRSRKARQLAIDNTPPPSAVQALTALVNNVLDPLRTAWGGPITVNSGYRCPALNAAVGGKPCSQHLLGQAADITVGSRTRNRQLLSLLRRLDLPVDQVIDEHNCQWLHISHRPAGSNRRQYLRI